MVAEKLYGGALECFAEAIVLGHMLYVSVGESTPYWAIDLVKVSYFDETLFCCDGNKLICIAQTLQGLEHRDALHYAVYRGWAEADLLAILQQRYDEALLHVCRVFSCL